MFAIRDDRFVLSATLLTKVVTYFARREYVNQEDLTKAARKVSEAKKHESKPMGLSTLDSGLIFSHHSQDGILCIDINSVVVYHAIYSHQLRLGPD
jgi:hypothetical protein